MGPPEYSLSMCWLCFEYVSEHTEKYEICIFDCILGVSPILLLRVLDIPTHRDESADDEALAVEAPEANAYA